MHNFPPHKQLRYIFDSEEKAIEFLLEVSALDIPESCPFCNGHISRHKLVYRCTKKTCRKAVSIYKGSFFAGNHLKANEALELAYYWLCGCTHTSILNILKFASDTVSSYFSHFRQLVSDSIDECDIQIGGPGIIVEVDESKFGKRKYHRGHHIEGAWVIAGIERTKEKRFFACVVESRSNESLVDVMQHHILPGSIVHTDCWRGYSQLSSQIDVEHKTVNHSKSFINPIDKTHTNTVEAKWGALKRKISIRGRVAERLDSHLFEQIWRHLHQDDLWSGFVSALTKIKYN